MIEAEHVTKRYGALYALNDVSLRVEKGGVTGLLGLNGAGKSTLMNILTGYVSVTSGRALLCGHDILLDPRAAKRCLGYLPERPPLYDEMTVRAFLLFVARLREVTRAAAPAHVLDIMERTGLSAVAERKIQNLSKGYRQRVGIAQALCGDPEVLLLDEPTVGLDPAQAAELRALIASLGGERTVLFSSHLLGEVEALCERVAILHRGRLLYAGAPRGLKRRADEITLSATVACAENTLLAAVRQLPFVAETTVAPSAAPDATSLVLRCVGEAEPEKRLFTLLAGMNAPLIALSRRESTLEEIFLAVTRGAAGEEAAACS